MMRLGIDVGSTTVKLILLDDDNKIIYQKYERHMSSVFDKVKEDVYKRQDFTFSKSSVSSQRAKEKSSLFILILALYSFSSLY